VRLTAGLRWRLWARAARVGAQTQMRPVVISAALGGIVRVRDLVLGGSGDLRPHLDHGLVPGCVWTCADSYTDYGPDKTEYWRTAQC
jgi:hypothetical protein